MSKTRSNCPVSCSLDIFGDKWTLLIIRDVMIKGKISYGEFLQSDEKIATNILASRLAMLEDEKILRKEVSTANKSKFEYSLTQKGADLLPVLVEMAEWSIKYNDTTQASTLAERITGRKEKFLKEVGLKLQERIKE